LVIGIGCQSLDKNETTHFHYTLTFRDIAAGREASISLPHEMALIDAFTVWLHADEPPAQWMAARNALAEKLPPWVMP